LSLRVVFAGTPEFAVPALRAIGQHHALVGVLTQPDRPAGRGRSLTASPVKQAALALGLPVAQPAGLKAAHADAAAARACLADWRPDVMVVVAYGLLLPADVLALPRLGCINIHASLLPRWRGAAPIQRAIEAGDDESGVAIMHMDVGLDTGPVLREARLPIGPEVVAGELHDALARLGAELVVQVLDELEAGRATSQAQPQSGVTYAAKLDKAEATIDWQAGVATLDRRIRAFNPWPCAQASLQGEAVKFWRSRVLSQDVLPEAPPGTVLGLRDGALAVACRDGVLGVLELQRAGRRRVAAADFLNAAGAAGALRFT
jgi:methionyl-tRNA formyltransferase